jgi:hypothetical protein
LVDVDAVFVVTVVGRRLSFVVVVAVVASGAAFDVVVVVASGAAFLEICCHRCVR